MKDSFGAIPLHYAVISLEENNIQALLSLDSDILAQDYRGNTVIHIALSRFLEDQDNFSIYKEIIKELLQFGASRHLKNEMDMTP